MRELQGFRRRYPSSTAAERTARTFEKITRAYAPDMPDASSCVTNSRMWLGWNDPGDAADARKGVQPELRHH